MSPPLPESATIVPRPRTKTRDATGRSLEMSWVAIIATHLSVTFAETVSIKRLVEESSRLLVGSSKRRS
jgi:hypothetical protein